MPKYLLIVDYQPGVVETPMTEWPPDDIKAPMSYDEALRQELLDSGELVTQEALTGPEYAKVVTSDGATAPVVTDGPFPEFKEMPSRAASATSPTPKTRPSGMSGFCCGGGAFTAPIRFVGVGGMDRLGLGWG